MRKHLRVLVLVHEDLVPPESIEGLSDVEAAPWKTEYDVTVTLRELGHDYIFGGWPDTQKPELITTAADLADEKQLLSWL